MELVSIPQLHRRRTEKTPNVLRMLRGSSRCNELSRSPTPMMVAAAIYLSRAADHAIEPAWTPELDDHDVPRGATRNSSATSPGMGPGPRMRSGPGRSGGGGDGGDDADYRGRPTRGHV